jgi:protein-S-isoprenylcysteine O-methyltransferase Ste14
LRLKASGAGLRVSGGLPAGPRGRPRRAFSALYFLGLALEMAIRAPHERRRGRARVFDDRVDGRERALLVLALVGVAVLPLVYRFTTSLDGADYRMPPESGRRAGGVGAAVLVLALWLFWRSHADLGRNWSPSLQIRDGHELVTGGVYARVRHPMYASEWLWGVAQALLLQNWIAGPSTLALFSPLYFSRVRREEQMMLDRFGEAYGDYMDRTGRVVPRLRG